MAKANLPENLPTFDMVDAILRYEPETGLFYWKQRRSNVQAGSKAGTTGVKGYVVFGMFNRIHRAHRVAWLLSTGAWPHNQIDHINGDRGDNRLSNLREASDSTNHMNIGQRADNKSGFKGVSFHRPTGKWIAQITGNKTGRYLGLYLTKEAAYEAYCAAAATLHGEFANFGNPTPR